MKNWHILYVKKLTAGVIFPGKIGFSAKFSPFLVLVRISYSFVRCHSRLTNKGMNGTKSINIFHSN